MSIGAKAFRADLGAIRKALRRVGATRTNPVPRPSRSARTAQPGYGWLAGADWQWINLAALGGGLWLLRQKIIRWHIPVAMLATLALLYTVSLHQ